MFALIRLSLLAPVRFNLPLQLLCHSSQPSQAHASAVDYMKIIIAGYMLVN